MQKYRRTFIVGYKSILRIVSFIGFAIFICHFKGIDLINLFNGLFSSEYYFDYNEMTPDYLKNIPYLTVYIFLIHAVTALSVYTAGIKQFFILKF